MLRRPSLPATFPRLHRRHDSILLDHHALRHKPALLRRTNTFLPDIRSPRVAGAKVTTGTVTVLLPPLYESLRSRPLAPSTTASTFAFVIVLFGPRSHA